MKFYRLLGNDNDRATVRTRSFHSGKAYTDFPPFQTTGTNNVNRHCFCKVSSLAQTKRLLSSKKGCLHVDHLCRTLFFRNKFRSSIICEICAITLDLVRLTKTAQAPATSLLLMPQRGQSAPALSPLKTPLAIP